MCFLVHRIGQFNPVNIYYILANHTIDDILWSLQQLTHSLGDVALSFHDFVLGSDTLSWPLLLILLCYQAYAFC